MIYDEKLANIMDKILQLDIDEKLVVGFDTKKELFRIRFKIYSLLNSLGRKEDFKISKKERDGKGKWMMEVLPTPNISPEVNIERKEGGND